VESIKLAIIGAGSSYTPELIEGLVKEKNSLPVKEIALTDIDEKRLDTMADFCRRYLKHLGHDINLTATTNRREAIAGAKFIDVQIRVGGIPQRILDEKIPLKYGLIGQETTGPGGMMKGLRTIPPMLDIAHDVEELSPDAWIVNYTNPTGLVAEAVNNYTQAHIAGLCSGGLFPRWWTSEALNVPGDSVSYAYVGLNHLNFAYMIELKDDDNPFKFGRPAGILVTDFGEKWIADPENSRLIIFNHLDQFDRFIGTVDLYADLFRQPTAVCKGRGNEVVVADSENGSIFVFNNGLLENEFGYDYLLHATGIVCDKDNRVWVVDSEFPGVYCFSYGGEMLFSEGRRGSESDYSFNSPTDISVLSDDRIIISDTGNDRLMVYKILFM